MRLTAYSYRTAFLSTKNYIMDDSDYLNVYEYVGEEKHEYTAATNISKEEHEMKKMVSPQEVHQQTQINQSSTDTHGFQKQAQEGAFKTTIKGIILIMLIILAVSVSISLAAIVLSIHSYNAQKLSIDTNLAFSKLTDNISDLAVRIDDILAFSKLTDNISDLAVRIDDITSVATTAELNISSLFIQLDIIYRFALSVQSEAVGMHCGAGLWYPLAHLNMTDPSQQCPSAWRDVTIEGIRVCARPNSPAGSCPGVLYHASYRYSKVCGRVIGYQFGSPDAFKNGVIYRFTIDEAYIEGVSITHGRNPRKHIWSYAAGASEINQGDSCSQINCPCNGGYEPPYYVGNNYYCESAHKDYCWVINRFFPNDPLWDGQQCDNDESTCCTDTNTPPWFSVDLPDSTSDDIEVRICHDQDTTDEDTPIQLLELYVQ